MRASLLLVVLTVVSGCGTSHVTAELATLTEVNERLNGRSADIVLASGEQLRVTGATLSCDWISIPRRSLTAQTRVDLVPIDDVVRITTVSRPGWVRGAQIGAVPGVALAGLGLYGSATCGDSLACMGNGVAFVAGAGLAVGGALIGGTLGVLIAPRRRTQVYEGPVGALGDPACERSDVEVMDPNGRL